MIEKQSSTGPKLDYMLFLLQEDYEKLYFCITQFGITWRTATSHCCGVEENNPQATLKTHRNVHTNWLKGDLKVIWIFTDGMSQNIDVSPQQATSTNNQAVEMDISANPQHETKPRAETSVPPRAPQIHSPTRQSRTQRDQYRANKHLYETYCEITGVWISLSG